MIIFCAKYGDGGYDETYVLYNKFYASKDKAEAALAKAKLDGTVSTWQVSYIADYELEE